MQMSNTDFNGRFGSQDQRAKAGGSDVTAEEDLVMEQILDNLNNTPIGQVLLRIASLPEIRKNKVLDVRRQLTQGKYDLSTRLDVALDKVMEELTT
jgi:hypothetical protein